MKGSYGERFTMNKRYQVFVSSTYTDLKEERNEVVKALLELDCIPCGMEYFPAASEDQWTYIKGLIQDCDYYVVIVAGRYGSISDEGISYTQMEYEYAAQLGIPCIAFLHKEPDSLPAKKTEKMQASQKKLQKFRKKLRTKLCKDWSDRHELGAFVSRSLIQLIKSQPRIGWVRADSISSDESNKQLLALSQKVATLEEENRRLKGDHVELDSLAQGDEELILDCEAQILTRDPERWRHKVVDTKKVKIQTTWNLVFRNLLPRIPDHALEQSIKGYISDFAFTSLTSEFHDTLTPNFCEKVKISRDSFHKVKVQTLALGLVETVSLNRGHNSGIKKVWKLTPRGFKKMYEVLAQRTEEGNETLTPP